MKQVKVGVIGLGWFGEMHLDTYRGVYGAQVDAVCTRRPEHLNEIAEKYHIEKKYQDYHELLRDEEIDAVSICTHAEDHVEPMLAAIKAGKHVLLEKPMARNVEACKQIVEAARHSQKNLMVGHICRFENNYAMAKQLIEAGRIGDVVSIYARRNVGGSRALSHLQVVSSITGDAVHDVDIVQWLVGKKAKTVYGMSTFTRNDIANSDIGWVNIKFEDGTMAVCESCWNLPDGSPFPIDVKMEVIGTKGVLYINDPAQALIVDDKTKREIQETVYWPTVHGHVAGALHAELQYFIDCILQEKKTDLIPLEDSFEVMRICIAAEESAKSGQIVTL